MSERGDWASRLGGTRMANGLLFLALLAFGAAGWMTLHRDEGYAVYCEAEADLYHLAEGPRIPRFEFAPESGRLTLEMANLDGLQWSISSTGPDKGERAGPFRIEGAQPVLVLKPGEQHFQISNLERGLTFRLHTQWVPGSPPVIVPTPIRIGTASPFSAADFVMRMEDESPADLEAAQRLLADFSVDDTADELEKIGRLSAAIEAALNSHRGVPTKRMKSLNGIEQFAEATSGRSKIYCANHAEIYAFLANAAGLPTRIADVTGTNGDVSLGAHTFNETYIAALNQWIYVDLQAKTAGIRDPNGHYLSAKQFIDRLNYDATESLIVRSLAGGEVREAAFDDFDNGAGGSSLRSLLSPASTIVYLGGEQGRFKLSERLKRLFLSPRRAICSAGSPHHVERRLFATYAAGFLGVASLALHLASRRSED
ncbi:MAG: hypothetical protein AB8G23_15695 [Myxococcota bacterium]